MLDHFVDRLYCNFLIFGDFWGILFDFLEFLGIFWNFGGFFGIFGFCGIFWNFMDFWEFFGIFSKKYEGVRGFV